MPIKSNGRQYARRKMSVQLCSTENRQPIVCERSPTSAGTSAKAPAPCRFDEDIFREVPLLPSHTSGSGQTDSQSPRGGRAGPGGRDRGLCWSRVLPCGRWGTHNHQPMPGVRCFDGIEILRAVAQRWNSLGARRPCLSVSDGIDLGQQRCPLLAAKSRNTFFNFPAARYTHSRRIFNSAAAATFLFLKSIFFKFNWRQK
jgi:hypothetical protein